MSGETEIRDLEDLVDEDLLDVEDSGDSVDEGSEVDEYISTPKGLVKVQDHEDAENKRRVVDPRRGEIEYDVVEWPKDAPTPAELTRWVKAKQSAFNDRVFSTAEVARQFDIDEEVARRLLESCGGVHSKKFDSVVVWW